MNLTTYQQQSFLSVQESNFLGLSKRLSWIGKLFVFVFHAYRRQLFNCIQYESAHLKKTLYVYLDSFNTNVTEDLDDHRQVV